jgi:hypothetical protein
MKADLRASAPRELLRSVIKQSEKKMKKMILVSAIALALTVNDSTFFFANANTGIRVNGSITVAADGLSITFTPNAPLSVNTRYSVQTSNITDLAGHSTSFFSAFTTGSQ